MAQGDQSPSSHLVQESAAESSENYLKKGRREVHTVTRVLQKKIRNREYSDSFMIIRTEWISLTVNTKRIKSGMVKKKAV